MKFKPYHYPHIDDLLRYYANALKHPEIIDILNHGILSEASAKTFCDFMPVLLDARSQDEKNNTPVPVENDSGIIPDLHYEAGSFVCDAGYEYVWDAMIDSL